MVDATDSKSVERELVGVRVPLPVPGCALRSLRPSAGRKVGAHQVVRVIAGRKVGAAHYTSDCAACDLPQGGRSGLRHPEACTPLRGERSRLRYARLAAIVSAQASMTSQSAIVALWRADGRDDGSLRKIELVLVEPTTEYQKGLRIQLRYQLACADHLVTLRMGRIADWAARALQRW